MNKLNSLSGLDDLKNSFRDDPDRTLGEIYQIFREEFISFAKRLCSDDSDIVDCFQDAIIALYENLIHDRIKSHQSTVKTYLFAIGKNKIMNRQRSLKKMSAINTEIIFDENQNHEPMDKILKEKLERGFNLLGDKCKMLLIKFYYQNYSIKEIISILGYKNENTVKAQKSRCMKQLKESIQHKINIH